MEDFIFFNILGMLAVMRGSLATELSSLVVGVGIPSVAEDCSLVVGVGTGMVTTLFVLLPLA